MAKNTQHKLKILWNSNAMWSRSGYGQQTLEILPHIRDEGYALAASNFFGQSGGKFFLDGILQYPIIKHTYGSDAMVLHGRDFGADVTISLQDTWILHPNDLQQVQRWIPWLPVDHDPIPDIVLDKLKYAYRIIAMSKFGQKQLQAKGLHSTYIPHSVNTEVFKPMNKFQRKKDSGMPADSFIIGMVAANKDNPPRKSFQEVLDVFKRFLIDEPKALLYLHTDPDFMGGFPIKQYAKFIGIPSDRVLFPDPYQMDTNIGKEQMNMIYNTLDVLLCPSISEGFGVPIIEAQSCGIPVIVNNFTAMPELIVEGETGFACKVARKWFSPQGSYMGIPDTDDLYDKLLQVHEGDRITMSKKARTHIVDIYDTKKIFTEKWIPFLSRIEKEVYPELDNKIEKTV